MDLQNFSPVEGTVFGNKMSREGKMLSLEEWINLIRTGKWKQEVEAVRAYAANNKPEEAKAIKTDLPMYVCTAVCEGGRKQEFITKRTQIAMLDFDRHDFDWSAKCRDRARKELDSAVAAYVTINGGLRIFVRIGEVEVDDWKTMYTLAGDFVEDWLDEECDRSCSDVLRGTFPSYDDQAWYRPWEEAEVVPYVADFQKFGKEQEERPVAKPAQPAERSSSASPRSLDCGEIIDLFFQKHSFHVGERNRMLFSLGTWAKYFHVQEWKMPEFIDQVVNRCLQPGLGEREIRITVRNGYKYGLEGPEFHPNIMTKGGGEKRAEGSLQGSRSYINPFFRANTNKSADNQSDDNTPEEVDEDQLIENTCPLFPDEIFEHLPSIIQRSLKVARSKRERDMLLMAVITNLSCFLPKVRVNYANRIYSAHLYFAAVSPAGSGKGIVQLAAKLGRKIDRLMKDRYKAKQKEYEHDLIRWENEKKEAYKQQREVNWELEPTEPRRQLLLFPPNTSKSQMLSDLEASMHVGMMMNTSEIDAFSAALKTDYGQHTSEIRMIYHHEEVGLNYKTDRRLIVVSKPRMAICMSGTLEQLVNLVGNIEDGTYSRFLLLTAPSIDKWVSGKPDPGLESADALFDELAEEVNDVFNFFNGAQEYRISFSDRQWELHSQVFEILLDEVSLEGEESVKAIVGRHGLAAIRIATVLTALRIYEDRQYFSPYTCSDEDFDIVLRMMKVLIRHSLQLSTILPNVRFRKPMARFDKLKYILSRLPEEFSYTDFVTKAMEYNYSKSWAKRGLKELVKKGFIAKTENGYKRIKRMSK